MEPKLLTAQRFVDQRTGCSYRYVYSETERFRPHWHEYYEVFVMLEGNALHKVNGATIKLHKGSMVFIRPNDCHDYIVEGNQSCSMVNITYSAETVDAVLAYLDEGFPAAALLDASLPPETQLSDYEFERFNRRMHDIRALDPGDDMRRKTLLRMLLFDILTRHFSNTVTVRDRVPLWLEALCAAVKRDGGFTH